MERERYGVAVECTRYGNGRFVNRPYSEEGKVWCSREKVGIITIPPSAVGRHLPRVPRMGITQGRRSVAVREVGKSVGNQKRRWKKPPSPLIGYIMKKTLSRKLTKYSVYLKVCTNLYIKIVLKLVYLY